MKETEKRQDDYLYKTINDPKLQKTPQSKYAVSLVRFILCTAAGETCTKNPKDAHAYFDKSLFGHINNLIFLPVTNPPASGIEYALNSFHNAGFIPHAYAAQGIGFAALKPFETLWKLFRNVSYLILVLVLIAIGFMIMFRVKIDPQTVISIENSIPRIIVALILITFSFAIAGFLIDLMYALITIIISIMSNNGILQFDATEVQTQTFGNGPFYLLSQTILHTRFQHIGVYLLELLPNFVRWIIRAITTFLSYLLLTQIPVIGQLITGDLSIGISGGGFSAGNLIGWFIRIFFIVVLMPTLALFAPLIITFLVYMTAFFVFLRILFTVIRSYIEILLLVIFAPVILLFEAIPGKNTFSMWIGLLIANLLTFPIVILILMLSSIILAIPSTGKRLWEPPFLASTSPEALSMIIGIAILFMIPNLIKMTRELLGIKGGLPGGVGVGLLFGGTTATVGSGMGILSQFSGLFYAKQMFGGLFKGTEIEKHGQRVGQGTAPGQTFTPGG